MLSETQASTDRDIALGSSEKIVCESDQSGNAHRCSHPFVFAMTGAYGLCGGIASANKNILTVLVELAKKYGRRLTVLSLLERESDRRALPEWVRFRGFGGNKWAFSLALMRVAGAKPLVCFDHVTLALPVLPMAATGFIKTVIFAHGSEAWKRVRSSSQLSFRFAALSLTNSEFTLRKMRGRLGAFRGEACPLGLSPDFRLNELPCNGAVEPFELDAVDGRRHVLGARVLLLVARLDPREGQKGHGVLIEALPRIISEFPDVQLVFPGPGEGRSVFEAQARRNGVEHAVFLPGRVSTELLNSLYRNCYAFVMPSKQEGFGLVYLEAMNYAKPCVGCADDGAEDVIVPGETGWLVCNPQDQDEVVDVLSSLLREPQLAKAYGENGLRRLHENFTAKHHQARIREHLEKLL